MQILQEQMKALDPNENEIYKFQKCEQAERINMKKVMERLGKIQMERFKWSREQEKGYMKKIW